MNDSRGSGQQAGASPTPWIVATVVFALAALGFAIWGFSVKSDRDDAEATVERQRRQLASEESQATGEERRLREIGARERAAYRRVRRALIRDEARAAELRKQVKSEASALERTRREADTAESAESRESARLREARARARLAVACSASAVDALNRFFDSEHARAGARAAVRQLESTRQECQTAARG